MSTPNRLIAAALLFLAFASPAPAQCWYGCFVPPPASANASMMIATPLTYQNVPIPTRATITISNNNKTGYCWIDDTGVVIAGNTTTTPVTTKNATGIPAVNASILLSPGGGSFGRYTFTPQGPVVATCDTAGMSIYAEYQ